MTKRIRGVINKVIDFNKFTENTKQTKEHYRKSRERDLHLAMGLVGKLLF